MRTKTHFSCSNFCKRVWILQRHTTRLYFPRSHWALIRSCNSIFFMHTTNRDKSKPCKSCKKLSPRRSTLTKVKWCKSKTCCFLLGYPTLRTFNRALFSSFFWDKCCFRIRDSVHMRCSRRMTSANHWSCSKSELATTLHNSCLSLTSIKIMNTSNPPKSSLNKVQRSLSLAPTFT